MFRVNYLPIVFLAVMSVPGCSVEQLTDAEIAQPQTIVPKLVIPLEFEEFTVADLGQVSDLKSLYDAKISMGKNVDAYEFLRRDLDDVNSYIRTETARQYLDARESGAGPYTTYDISMNSWFVQVVPVLVFVNQAVSSKQSHLTEDLTKLPVSVLPWFGSDERKKLEKDTASGLRIADYVSDGRITELERKEPNEIFF